MTHGINKVCGKIATMANRSSKEMPSQEDMEGEFGNGQYFSDLFVKCIELPFSGGILVWSEEAETEGRIFFSQGRPFLCSGELYPKHKLGEILQKLGMVTEDDVDLALRVQQTQEDEQLELLGTLLQREAYVSEDAIEAALQIQTKKRLIDTFGIERGMWRALWSERQDLIKKGAIIEPWDVLVPGITLNSSSVELRDLSDELLGNAVKLTCPIEALEKYGATEEHEPFFTLLEKPRRPDHIEKSLGRQQTRSLLKALSLSGVLERYPARKGIPIESPQQKTKRPNSKEAPERIATPVREEVIEPIPRIRSSITKYDDATLRIIVNIETTYEKLDEMNYFEVLDANPHSNGRELRAKYTELVRKFHPDALGPKKLSKEVLSKAADISARLNESFQTLTHDNDRAEYLKIYNDQRIGGKTSQKSLLDEADKKFKMATVLLKKKDFEKAREYLNYACNMIPNDGRYKAHLAWSLWIDPSLVNETINERVMELLSEAVSLSPSDPETHFYYGSVLKMNGDIKAAIKHFKVCVGLKPNYTEAVRELRLLRSRIRK